MSCWVRTSDLLLRRQLLYPTELRTQEFWLGGRDSNPRPKDYESSALTNWATPHYNVVFKPRYPNLNTLVCFNLINIECLNLVPWAGIEPARRLGREILSLLCLPISPPRLVLKTQSELRSHLRFQCSYCIILFSAYRRFLNLFYTFFYSTLTSLKNSI